jgi:hypothetical protein
MQMPYPVQFGETIVISCSSENPIDAGVRNFHYIRLD